MPEVRLFVKGVLIREWSGRQGFAVFESGRGRWRLWAEVTPISKAAEDEKQIPSRTKVRWPVQAWFCLGGVFPGSVFRAMSKIPTPSTTLRAGSTQKKSGMGQPAPCEQEQE